MIFPDYCFKFNSMRIDYRNPNERISIYEFGKTQLKITEKKLKHGVDGKKDMTPVNSEMGNLDAVVRNHEKSHLNALGPYASGNPVYDFVSGPGGRTYAAGGSIKVDLSPVPGNPEATLAKANTIMYASMAPGSVSGADRNVADKALTLAMQAKKEINEKTQNGNSRFDMNDILSIYKSHVNSSGESGLVDLFA